MRCDMRREKLCEYLHEPPNPKYEVAIPRHMFEEILRLIAALRPMPPPAPA
jgi:hypothetical protein